jgi:hypothetical protein
MFSNHHVRPCGELLHLLESSGIFEVHAGGPLVAVYGEEIGRLAPGERWPSMTGVIATLGVFDLENVRPEVSEHHRRIRTGEDP